MRPMNDSKNKLNSSKNKLYNKKKLTFKPISNPTLPDNNHFKI